MDMGVRDWGFAIAIAVFVIHQLFDMLKQSRKDGRDDIKSIGRRLTDFEKKFESKLDAITDKLMGVTIGAEKLMGALRQSQQKDMDFHDRQLPALERKLSRIEFDGKMTRDGLNDTRHHLGLPPIGQTPAEGVRVQVGVPVHLEDE
jgi:hypothetical protein